MSNRPLFEQIPVEFFGMNLLKQALSYDLELLKQALSYDLELLKQALSYDLELLKQALSYDEIISICKQLLRSKLASNSKGSFSIFTAHSIPIPLPFH